MCRNQTCTSLFQHRRTCDLKTKEKKENCMIQCVAVHSLSLFSAKQSVTCLAVIKEVEPEATVTVKIGDIRSKFDLFAL